MPRFLGSEPPETILSVLEDALDLVEFGIVLLNPDLRVCFLNRSAYSLCGLDPAFLKTAPTFRELIGQAEATDAGHMQPEELAAYLDEREAEVRSGSVPSRLIELGGRRNILFGCVACPSGRRILTYADISAELHNESLQATARINAELRFSTELLEEQGANLASLAEAAEENAQKAETARLLLEQEIAERSELEIMLRRLATTDGLTGALNRSELLTSAQRETDLRRAVDAKVAVLMIDVDHFKAINDHYGHAGGDKALQLLVTILKAGVRQTDLVGRLGGEEFAIVLLDTPTEAARVIAEWLRTRVAEAEIPFGEQTIIMTISVGLSTLQASDRSIEQVLGRADEALYRAKRGGRNRVVTDLHSEAA